MPKLTKRTIDATQIKSKDCVIWDDDLSGFGLRLFASNKRSYVVQYRTAGRSRCCTIELHGVWAPEEARREAKVPLARSLEVEISQRSASSTVTRLQSRNSALATSKM